MKTLSVLLILVLLVTLVAVSGSRAQPVPGTSAAFDHCIRSEAAPTGRCLPIGNLRAAFDDIGGDRTIDQIGDAGGYFESVQGEQLSNPDLWREVALAVFNAGLAALVGELAKWAGERLAGGTGSSGRHLVVPPTLFDPAR